MELKLILWGLFLLVISCNTAPRNNSASDNEKEDEIAEQQECTEENDSTGVIWMYTFNQQTETFEMKKMLMVDNDTLTGEALETIINVAWPGVQIQFTGTSNDTVYLAIPESRILTQQMGSAGARSFLITTTWSFTELKGIRYVAFDFEYGDHAMPGVYNRTSWEE